MLNVFALKSAISESTGFGGFGSTVGAHNFIGELDESTFAEMSHMIMVEAAEIQEFVGVTDELMVEAVMSGASAESVDALVENVFTNIVNGIKKFIDKIIAAIKGLIERLKAAFFKMTQKNSKWLTIMKPRITDAKNRGGASDFKYTMYNWDTAYITSGLLEGSKKFAESEIGNIGNNKTIKKSIIDKAVSTLKSLPTDPQDAKVLAYIKDTESIVDVMTRAAETATEDAIKDAANALGVSSATTTDVLWREVEKKATGGDKIEQAIYSKVDGMINSIDKSSEVVKNLEEAYKKQLKSFEDTRKRIDAIDQELKGVTDKVPSSAVSAAKSVISKTFNNMTSILSTAEKIVDTARSKNLKFAQAMASDYMSALTAFSNLKAKK